MRGFLPRSYKSRNSRVIEIAGSFPTNTVAVKANKTWAYASAKVVTFTYTTSATAAVQNAMHMRITDTGATACHYVASTTENDAQYSTLSETGWTLQFDSHSHTGGGVLVIEDTTAKTLLCVFEEGVSTMADLKTAINAGCTKVRAFGGTKTGALTKAADAMAATAMNVDTVHAWLSLQSATDIRVAAIITGSHATVAEVMAIVNESTLANKKITAVLTTGTASDDVTTALSDTHLDTVAAVDAVALDTTAIKGEGFSVSRTGASGTGEYTVTLDNSFANHELVSVQACMQLPTAEATYPATLVQVGAYTAASKTIVLTTFDGTTGSANDPVYTAGRNIHFRAKLRLLK